ncbi:uncharacterized protein LOC116952999 isoform X2 [Petromyzon marinus]|uniref:Uncharacterized protein LOC116952999 isoform X2 n=1 Tax=Petromyzon marinus TaxID=7757 RepID=A0AAJ7U2L5_PETMA|nr:uncharacterized protein LOC116952999 isoform X2 [Petromyzon marinus]
MYSTRDCTFRVMRNHDNCVRNCRAFDTIRWGLGRTGPARRARTFFFPLAPRAASSLQQRRSGWAYTTMAGRMLGSLFKLASSLRDYIPSLVTGVLMPVMIACAQPLFGLFAFHCPCTSPENWSYTLWALAAPFGVVSVVGFTIQLCTTLRAAETLARKYGCDNCCCRFVFFVGASLFRNVTFMFAAMAWPILALFDGSYVVCGGTEVLDWTRFPALGNLSHLGEKQRRNMLARVPCKELKEPFPGLVTNETHDDIREQIVLFLRASSQDRSTLLKSEYERYEAQFINEKTKELAKTIAERNVSHLFDVLSRIRAGQDTWVIIPSELQYVDNGEDCSDLDSWLRSSGRGPRRGEAEVGYTPLLPDIGEESG